MARTQLKDRARYPSGRAKPDDQHPVTRIKAILAAAEKAEPVLGTAIGYLHFQKHLTIEHVTAASHYMRLRAAQMHAAGIPSPNPHSAALASLQASGRVYSDDEHDARVIARYEKLRGYIGDRPSEILDAVTIRNEYPSWPDHAALRNALNKVGLFMGIVNK